MLLAYTIQIAADDRLHVLVVAAEARRGQALGQRVYPQDAGELLRDPASLDVTPEDQRILMQMVMHQPLGGDGTFVAGRSAHRLCTDMLATGRLYAWQHRARPLRLGPALPTRLVWRDAETGCRPGFTHDPALRPLPCVPPICWDPKAHTCHPVALGIPDEVASVWLSGGDMSLDRAARFLDDLLMRHPRAEFPPPPGREVRTENDVSPVPVLEVCANPLADAAGLGAGRLLLRLRFGYRGREVAPDDPAPRARFLDGALLRDIGRAFAAEARARQALLDAGLVPFTAHTSDLFATDAIRNCWTLDDRLDWGRLLNDVLPELERAGWRVRWDSDVAPVPVADADWYTRVAPAGKDWLGFEAGVRIGGARVNILPVVRQFLHAHRDLTPPQLAETLAGRTIPVPVPGGVALLGGDRLLLIIRNLFELYGGDDLGRHQRLRLAPERLAELAELEPLSEAPWQVPEALRGLRQAFASAVEIAPADAPATLQAHLRPYQRLGLGWLRFLRDHGLGGILADDMGLGKTVQTIALLLEGRGPGSDEPPDLVVAPTSLIPNWRDELTRFAPALRVLVLHGQDRHALADQVARHDVVLTSYALLRRDQARYAALTFRYAVLDEATAIKNPQTQVAHAAFGIAARHRLCLSGTPMENHLGELWSLMRFAMPGFLGPPERFRVQFQTPIERQQNTQLRDILRRRLRPFVLRRTKAAVAPELPPKTEILQRVELSDRQRDLYQAVQMAMSQRIRAEMEARGLERSYIIVLDALLKLREICCDPRLRDPDADTKLPDDSCKLAALSDRLPALVEEGRRILVFTQFRRMVPLIGQMLDAHGIAHVELTGETTDRETPVRRFQNGDVPVFLLTLKAGGHGLNLQTADTVVLYDPWWNPAVEAQAGDRAHRIGQRNPVFVYRLVALDTVEDRILALQARKRELVDSLLDETTDASALRLTAEEISELLAPLPRRAVS